MVFEPEYGMAYKQVLPSCNRGLQVKVHTTQLLAYQSLWLYLCVVDGCEAGALDLLGFFLLLHPLLLLLRLLLLTGLSLAEGCLRCRGLGGCRLAELQNGLHAQQAAYQQPSRLSSTSQALQETSTEAAEHVCSTVLRPT